MKPLSVIPSSVAGLGETFRIKFFISSSSSGARVLSKHFLYETEIFSIGLGLPAVRVLYLEFLNFKVIQKTILILIA